MFNRNQLPKLHDSQNHFYLHFKNLKFTSKYPPQRFQDVISMAYNAFGASHLPPVFKLFYTDDDNDIITVSNQEEYKVLLEDERDMVQVFIAENADKAKNSIPQSLKHQSDSYSYNDDSRSKSDKRNTEVIQRSKILS